MSRGRWKESKEQLAVEAYAVLIERRKATRTYPKSKLISLLRDPAIYMDFLKYCFEFDDSDDLRHVRRGLLFILQAANATQIAKKAGFSRMSLYRMLSDGGNPRLKNLVSLFRALDLRLWTVDEEFVKRRKMVIRPKYIPYSTPQS